MMQNFAQIPKMWLRNRSDGCFDFQHFHQYQIDFFLVENDILALERPNILAQYRPTYSTSSQTKHTSLSARIKLTRLTNKIGGVRPLDPWNIFDMLEIHGSQSQSSDPLIHIKYIDQDCRIQINLFNQHSNQAYQLVRKDQINKIGQ